MRGNYDSTDFVCIAIIVSWAFFLAIFLIFNLPDRAKRIKVAEEAIYEDRDEKMHEVRKVSRDLGIPF